MAINDPTVRIKFLGATRTVTGSKYLIQNGGKKILVDGGLFQGEKELRLRNWAEPPFNPAELDAILVTHAHIDHTGYLPLLVRRGFAGPIYCTAGSMDLIPILLSDSAHLQEEEAGYANAHGTSRHHPAKPLYDRRDADGVKPLLRSVSRDTPVKIFDGVHVSYSAAGHILGACTINLDIAGKRISFSGDIGRYAAPLIPDPKGIELGTVLLIESTYADKQHPPVDTATELEQVIRLIIEKDGPLIVPAFAVGRTQTLLYYLAELERAKRIPELPVFVDSPMASDVTALYRRHEEDQDAESRKLIESDISPFLTRRTKFCRTVEQSKAINDVKGPRIIIAASGMVNGGRVLHHLARLVSSPQTTVLFVGYQAQGTRGQQIQSGAESIKIFGQHRAVKAGIRTISGLSAHGDRDELLRWIRSSSGSPSQVFTVHGEDAACSGFARTIESDLGWKARPAEYLEEIAF